MNAPDKRGESVALMGFLLSLLISGALFVLALWCDGETVFAAALQMAGGIGIWLITLIQLHQARLVAEERLEVAELERSRQDLLGGAKTIFDEEELGQMEQLATGRRLRAIEKFLVPTLGLLTAAYFLVAGGGVMPWNPQNPVFKQFSFISTAAGTTMLNQTAVLFLCGGIAFVCFMFSRYCLGMAKIREWSLLRAGGNFLFGASAINLAIVVGTLCSISGLNWVEGWLTWIIGIFLLAQAAEAVINFIFDFYRPRTPGQIHRPFYDSRFLGMFSEPEGILRSMAKSIDYQFGFKVSETWFYRLLGRIVLPLIIVQTVVVFALTCITVVPPGHKAVVEHLGEARDVFGPGVHLTWFWPVDQTTIIPVEAIQRLEIGYERSKTGEFQQEINEGAILWTKKHYKKEYLLLVADKGATLQRSGDDANTSHSGTAGAPPLNMLSMNMPVQWRVAEDDKQVLRFHSQAADVPGIIESLAYRELTQYAAGHDVYELLGKKGIETAAYIQQQLQKACDHSGYDGQGLGVTIVHVGIGGVHPPPDDDVAKSYEDVVSAYETKDAKIKISMGAAAEMRILSAGDGWETIYKAIRAEDEALDKKSPDAAAKTAEVERLLRTAVGGEARIRASRALKATLARVFDVMSSSEQYALQLNAYQASPKFYTLRMYLKLLSEGLERMRKYVIVMEDSSRVLIQADLKPPTLMDVMGAEGQSIDAKQSQ